MRALALGLTALIALAVLVTGEPVQTGAAPAAVGCPACHGAAGREPGLDAVTKTIKNHPAIAAKTVQQCALCHSAGPTPPPLRTMLHKIHLNSSKFATAYKGTCTSCHSVDKATGAITVFGLER